jgi:hypothetical protein
MSKRPTPLGVLLKACISIIVGMLLILILGVPDGHADKILLSMLGAVLVQAFLDYRIGNI